MIIQKNVSLYLAEDIRQKFIGIRVIADVHGSLDAFERAIKAASLDNRYVIQLGDIIDRGPYSSLCVERMLEVEAQGRGMMLMGNHEIAFANFLLNGVGGAVTRHATLLQFEEYGEQLAQRYVARIQKGPLWIRTDNLLFVHAAFHPKMLSNIQEISHNLQEIATHGFGTSREQRSSTQQKEREWVDLIPKGLTVVVGHRVTPSGMVEHAVGRHGGKAIFADTGIWRGSSEFPTIDLPL